MKYLIISLLFSSASAVACSSAESVPPKKDPEVKRVCIKTYDAAQKKEVEKCRTTKIREKKEGTPIPK